MNNTSLKHWVLFSAPLLLMLFALWIGFDTERDVALFFKESQATHPVLTTVLQSITDWSNPFFYCVYAVMLIQAIRKGDFETRRHILILFGIQLIVALLCVQFIKRTIGRPRPTHGPFWNPITSKGVYHSLPSGHTTEFVGWTLPLALRQHHCLFTLLLGVFVAILGFSRIYLQWHNPTDVFFGWMLGCFTALAASVITGSALFRKHTTA